MGLSKGGTKCLCLNPPKALRRSVLCCRVSDGTAKPADIAVITSSNRPGRAFVLPGGRLIISPSSQELAFHWV